MENATKALLMAGGILISIIIISVLVVTFQRTGSVSKGYDATLRTEQITKFNSNFTKYLGQKLTIYDVVTIYNFAQSNNTKVVNCSTEYDETDIQKDLNDIEVEDGKRKQKAYKINISYDSNSGYVSNINFTNDGWIEL